MTQTVKVKRRPIRKTPYEWYVHETKKWNVDRTLSKDEWKALHKDEYKKKITPYQRYVIRARELNVPIFTEGEYYASVDLHEQKGRKVNPELTARWQFFDDHTDKQIDAMWKAAKLQNPELTRDQFISEKGWNTIDQQASALYKEIKATEEYQKIEAEIEELEDKGEDRDFLDTRRLNRLKADKEAMLHAISQQIYGSE